MSLSKSLIENLIFAVVFDPNLKSKLPVSKLSSDPFKLLLNVRSSFGTIEL